MEDAEKEVASSNVVSTHNLLKILRGGVKVSSLGSLKKMNPVRTSLHHQITVISTRFI